MEESKYVLAIPCVEAIDFGLVNCHSQADEEMAIEDFTYLFQNRYPDCEVIVSVCTMSELPDCMKKMRNSVRESVSKI